MLCQGKNYYHMKHSSVLVHDHVPPPFNRQCSLGMRGFQIGLRNKLLMFIVIVLHHKQVPLNVRRYFHTVYDLFCHTVCM